MYSTQINEPDKEGNCPQAPDPQGPQEPQLYCAPVCCAQFNFNSVCVYWTWWEQWKDMSQGILTDSSSFLWPGPGYNKLSLLPDSLIVLTSLSLSLTYTHASMCLLCLLSCWCSSQCDWISSVTLWEQLCPKKPGNVLSRVLTVISTSCRLCVLPQEITSVNSLAVLTIKMCSVPSFTAYRVHVDNMHPWHMLKLPLNITLLYERYSSFGKNSEWVWAVSVHSK